MMLFGENLHTDQSGEDPGAGFMIAAETGGLAAHKLGEKTRPRLTLVDIPDEGRYYLRPVPMTAAVVEKIVVDYKGEKLEREQQTLSSKPALGRPRSDGTCPCGCLGPMLDQYPAMALRPSSSVRRLSARASAA
eukprot:4873495-Amphidinium_carterae.1